MLDGNKLIAEFMGNKMNGDYYISGYNAKFPTTDLVHPLTLAYNEDWNWIMPVVEKIESLEQVDYTKLLSEPKNFYQFEINLKTDSDQSSFNVMTENKMESIYDCLVAFIKWYNEQTKK